MTTLNTYLLNEIKHAVRMQCHGNYIWVKKINYMLEIDIFRTYSQKNWGALTVLGVYFVVLGVYMMARHPAD